MRKRFDGLAQTGCRGFRTDRQPNQNKEGVVMKSILTILGITLLAWTPVSFVRAQTTPSPASSDKPAVAATPVARTDVYHVHFVKAVPGKAAQVAENLKKQDPKAPMPGHRLVLRHQEGEAWDYVEIEHLGTKVTVEATRPQLPAEQRNLTEWHNDTYVNGPSWAEFTRALAISDDSAAKSASSVYVVTVYRAAPGQRDALEKMLGEPPDRPSDTSAGEVLLQHLEGAEWNFLAVTRYNSWQEFATNESNSVAASAKNQGGWFRLREYIASHADTITRSISR
jgi:hypothetical protein